MSQPPFTMSKYASELDLQRAAHNYYREECERLVLACNRLRVERDDANIERQSDAARLDFLDTLDWAGFVRCNKHVPRSASLVEMGWMERGGTMQILNARSVREAIDEVMGRG